MIQKSHAPSPATIVLIGASTRAFADCWRRAGYDCLCVDQYADADLTSWASVFASISQLQQSAVFADAHTVGWVYTGPGEYNAIEQISQTLGLDCWGMSSSQVQQLRRFSQQLAQSECPIRPVRSLCVREAIDLVEAGQQVLIKPRNSAAGLGIEFSKLETLNHISSNRQSNERFEPFLAGQTYGLSCLGTDKGIELLGICQSYNFGELNPSGSLLSPFRYAGSFGPVQFEDSMMSQITALLEFLFETVFPVGLFGIDLLLHEGQLWLLEINPRFTSSMEVLELTTGVPMAARHTSCFGQSSLPTVFNHVPHTPSTLFKQIVYATREICWPAYDWQQLAASLGGRCSDQQTEAPLRLADLPAAGSITPAYSPALTIYSPDLQTGQQFVDRVRQICGF